MRSVAECLVAANRGAAAVPVIDECIRLSTGRDLDPGLVPPVVTLRLHHFEQAKDAAGCRQTAEMWEDLKRTDPLSLYKSACCRVVTATVLRAVDKSASATHQADTDAERGMAWLKQAVAAGYKNATQIKADKDLDSLRAREDFKRLVAKLEQVNKSEKANP
jgi:hypothetical protein